MSATHPSDSPRNALTPQVTQIRATREEARRFTSPERSGVTFSVMARHGSELAVSLAARPVHDLLRGTVVGHRLDRTVRRRGGEAALRWAGRATLDPGDLKRIDVQTLRHGMDLLSSTPDGIGIAPAFWRTVTTSPGRLALLYAGLETEADPHKLLVELRGGAEHASTREIVEVLKHLEGQRRRTIVHASPIVGQLQRLAEAQPPGVAIDFAGVETGSAAAWSGAAGLIAAARAAAPSVLLLGLPTDRGEAAAAAGATHAVFAAMQGLTA